MKTLSKFIHLVYSLSTIVFEFIIRITTKSILFIVCFTPIFSEAQEMTVHLTLDDGCLSCGGYVYYGFGIVIIDPVNNYATSSYTWIPTGYLSSTNPSVELDVNVPTNFHDVCNVYLELYNCGNYFLGQTTGDAAQAQFEALLYPNCGATAIPPTTIDDNGDNGPTCSQSQCSLCSGMPVWSVSDPYTSLWIKDEPLGYQPAIGPRISFNMAFKQREMISGYNTNFFSIGKKWNFSWLSYVAQNTSGSNVVYFPGGGKSSFTTTNDYLTNTRLSGNTNSGYTVLYPDGSQNVYGFIVTNGSGVFQEAFLTQMLNPQGQSTTLSYASYNPVSPVIRLQSIIDGDGRTNFVNYVTSNGYSTNLISSIVDAFGRTNSLVYDANGHLTNSVDVDGISSSFVYDNNDWITNMITPYGTTKFSITDSPSNAPSGRSVLVTQPDGGNQLYLYQDSASNSISSYSTNQIPNTSPFTNTLDDADLNLRDTYYWGPRQYASLSTTNVAAFTSNDFLKARMRHWMQTISNVVDRTLSIERDPSPDSAGNIPGQMTWYDYAGKPSGQIEGSQILPLFTARILPDSTTSFTRTDRNAFGAAIDQISTYTANGTVALRTNSFGYAANGIDLLNTTNALGVQTSSNTYNTNHEVLTSYDSLSELTTYTYDSSNRLTSITHPTGLLTTNIYGTGDLLIQQIDIGFATNSYTYTNNLVYTHTDPRGLTTTNTWDALNRLIGTVFPDGSSVSNQYTYLDITATKDRLGNWAYFGYDSMRRKIAETNALGNTTFYDYCTCGSLNSIQDPAGNLTQFSYDNQGNLTNTLYADNYSLTHIYDLLHRVVSTFDSSGTGFTNTYNNQGLSIAVTNSAGQLSASYYDVLDRITNSVDANTVSINTTYDNLNRPINRSYPDGGIEYWGYTLNISGATSYTNQIGNSVLYSYDAMNRKTNEVDVGITTNLYAYNGAGDLLTLTDGKNDTTTWSYDSFGRVTNKVDAAGNLLFVYQYDSDNRLTNRWSASKGSTTYGYDAIGNLTHVSYPVSPAITIGYDKLNRMTNMVDAVGTNTYIYDAVGQLLSEGGLWPNDTVNYTYNNRLRTGLSLLQPGATAWTQGYGYDGARRLTSLNSPEGTFGYTYDSLKLQRVDAITLPNGAYITNSYDSVARELATKLLNSSGTTLDSAAYAYNQASQRTAETNTAGDFRTYTYDSEGELTAATGMEAGGVINRWQEQFGYIYDAAGNLNTRRNDTLYQTFNVNSLNQLTTINHSGTLTVAGTTTSLATNVTVNMSNAVLYADATFACTNQPLVNSSLNTFTAIAKDVYGRMDTNTVSLYIPVNGNYSYDLNGNFLSEHSVAGTNRIFSYDDENELTSVLVTNEWRNDFVYDGKMRRRIEKDFTWQGSSWVETNEVHFVYDGNVVIQERNTNNVVRVTYTRGNDMSGTLQGAGGIGGLLSRTDANGNSYYHADGNGNITMLINNLQLIVAKYFYDPFGNTLSLSGSLAYANVYRFSSKEWNDNGGVYYYHYRFYDPNLQRWLNRDPLGDPGFELMQRAAPYRTHLLKRTPIELLEGPNLYDYVANDPINSIDPLGLWTFSVGVTVSLKWWVFDFSVSAGIVGDTQGNINTYTTGGAGAGLGEGLSAGVSVATSNAKNNCDLTGKFGAANLGGFVGGGGSGDVFWGNSNDGPVFGGGLTVGVGLGGGAAADITDTGIGPIDASSEPTGF